MKLTNKTYVKATKSGMTLLELTVVILVLLSLISILFIGARAWKRGSDRAASILTIRNAQQAVRSYANLNGKNAGDAIIPGSSGTPGDVFGSGKFMENNPVVDSTHPAGTDYEYVYGDSGSGVVPDVGVLYIEVDGSATADEGTTGEDYMPTAGTYNDW